jgi:hypothetical protein
MLFEEHNPIHREPTKLSNGALWDEARVKERRKGERTGTEDPEPLPPPLHQNRRAPAAVEPHWCHLLHLSSSRLAAKEGALELARQQLAPALRGEDRRLLGQCLDEVLRHQLQVYFNIVRI